MITRNRWLLMGVGLLALAAVRCDRGHDRARAGRSSLTVIYWDNQWPVLFTDSSSQFLVFLPLVTRNAKGDLEGRLADRWEHSSDYRTWTIHLRTDVKWQDGVPVTAHDVKFTLELMMHPDVLSVPPGALSVTVLDDSTYTIAYPTRAIVPANDSGPTGSPMDDYTVYYPKHMLENLDPKAFKSWEFWTRPVGNGPYRYVRHVPHTMMEFEANPEYYRGKPKIDRVVLKFIALNASEGPELLSGNAQAAQWSSFGTTARHDPRFENYYEIGGGLRGIVWNHRHQLFREPGVRQALTLAINRPELHKVLDLPAGLPILDVVPTNGQMSRGEIPDPLPYDPERAKRLLDAAGWHVDRNGVRTQNGKPYRFTVLTSSTNELEKAAVYIQAQLHKVGIRMDIQTMDWSGVKAHVTAGTFEAAMVHMNRNFTSPIGLLWLFGPESALGYFNPKVITLFNKSRETLDPDEVDRIHREAMPIFQADLPVTFLYPAIDFMAASRRVRGLSSPYRADVVRYMEDLWLEDRSD